MPMEKARKDVDNDIAISSLHVPPLCVGKFTRIAM